MTTADEDWLCQVSATTAGEAQVVAIAQRDCVICGGQQGKCTSAKLFQWRQGQQRMLVANDIGAEVGDRVKVRFRQKSVIIAALLLFLVPLLCLLLASALADWLSAGNLSITVVVAVLALLSGIGVARYLAFKLESSLHVPYITKIV